MDQKYFKIFEYGRNQLKWFHLSKNKSITFDFISSRPELPWDFEGLCENPNMTFSMLYTFYKLKDDEDDGYILENLKYILTDNQPEIKRFHGINQLLSSNRNITIDLIKTRLNYPWCWFILSQHINLDDIMKNPSLPWEWDGLSFRRDITLNFVKRFNTLKPMPITINYHFEYSVDINNIINEFPHLPYKWYIISHNPSITWDIIVSNPNRQWDWYWLSTNPNVTWEVVTANPNKNWNWSGLSSNPNVNWDIVKTHLNNDWNWDYLSENPSMTWDIITTNSDMPWQWEHVSLNPNITWKIVYENANKPWDIMNVAKLESIE